MDTMGKSNHLLHWSSSLTDDRSRSKRSDPFAADVDILSWPLLAAGLVLLLVLLVVLVICMCRKSSAVKRSLDGKDWVQDRTPVVFGVNPGYDNLAFFPGKEDVEKGMELNSTSDDQAV